MSTKRVNEYEVIFTHLKNNKGETISSPAIKFLFENHDDILSIIEKLSERRLFEKEADTIQFVIGLKLFSDIMIKNRDMELFTAIQPAFVDFMKKLKNK